MRTLFVIPARIGAARLPRKPLRELGGAPMIVRVWQRVAGMCPGERTIVATDDDGVARAVRDAGGEAVLTDAACDSGTARVAAVAARPEFAAYDAFVNVQGDEPFVSPAFVTGALAALRPGHDVTIGTAAAPADPALMERSSVVKVVLAAGGRALYFSRAPIPWLRDSADAPLRASTALQHVGVYAYTRAALERWMSLPPHPLEIIERLEQLRPLANGMNIGVTVVDERPETGIDTEDDLIAANARWATFAAGEPACH